MAQISVCWTSACPVSMLCPNRCVFIEKTLKPKIDLSQTLAIATKHHLNTQSFILEVYEPGLEFHIIPIISPQFGI